jgi:HAD superfamily hydrolase (TIGR01490 family)
MLALFDLDNTLLHGDSDHLWGEFLIDKQLVDPVWHKEQNDRFFVAYQDGTLNIKEWLEFQLKPMTLRPYDYWVALRGEFIETHIKPIVLKKGREALEEHRQRNDILVIITATNYFITRPIADILGVEHLLATRPEVINNRFSGDTTGTITYQEGKITALNEWMKRNHTNLTGSAFYSDSFNDIPLLSLVDTPVAVDPDNTLRQHAIDNGWNITSFRM